MRIARSTGVAGGLLIALLGIWGALIPFVGPYFDYSFGVNSTWHYTVNRLWLDVLPGGVALLAGLILLEARSRSTAALGAWLAILAGTWFVIGNSVSLTWTHGAPIGAPLYGSTRQMLELIGYFYLLGALIIALGAFELGRLVPAHAVVGERGRGRAGAAVAGSPAAASAPAESSVSSTAAPAGAPAPARPGAAESGERVPRRIHMPFSRRPRAQS